MKTLFFENNVIAIHHLRKMFEN